MFSLNPMALLLIAIVAASMTLGMLVFSPRDTVRGVVQLFDVRLVTRFLWSAFGRFSLRQLLIAFGLASVAMGGGVWFVRSYGEGEWGDLAWRVFYGVVVVVPLLVYFFTDAFGSPRRKPPQETPDFSSLEQANRRDKPRATRGRSRKP